MRRWTEERMERFIGGLLRVGVLLAVALVFSGAVLYLARHGGERADYTVFRGQSQPFGRIVRNAWATLGGRNLILFGLIALVATPIARVVFSVFAFAAQDDKKYVVITLIVLAVLGFNLFGTPL